MLGNQKIAIAAGAAVILIAVSIFIVVSKSGDDSAGPEGPVVVDTPMPEPTPTPTLAEQLSARLQGVTLATSDEAVRELVSELSSRPELVSWLANEDLVRRFTATIDNLADGKSPRSHLDFLGPKKRFKTRGSGDFVKIDPRSYSRYDLVTTVIDSLDPVGTVTLYRELAPLAREAYREIAPPGAVFDDRLISSIDHLLATPDIGEDVEVKVKVVTYTYVDERLERLSPAQRHLLRMGPANAATVKNKLRQLKEVLLAPDAPEPTEAEAGAESPE